MKKKQLKKPYERKKRSDHQAGKKDRSVSPPIEQVVIRDDGSATRTPQVQTEEKSESHNPEGSTKVLEPTAVLNESSAVLPENRLTLPHLFSDISVNKQLASFMKSFGGELIKILNEKHKVSNFH